MQVRDAMTQDVQLASPTQTLRQAALLMAKLDAGVLPVADKDSLVGMITDRDIVLRVVAEGKDPQATNVGEIASRDIVTIDPQQSMDEALRLMEQHQVRRLPVVEEDGRLVGILAQADIARHGTDQLTGELVERISK